MGTCHLNLCPFPDTLPKDTFCLMSLAIVVSLSPLCVCEIWKNCFHGHTAAPQLASVRHNLM